MSRVEFQNRREAREPVEMMARFRHGITTVTVMLKDITPHGARVAGVGPLAQDDAIFLMLPGHPPRLAFVAWSNLHGAGLEFAAALCRETFDTLVTTFGRRFEAPAVAA